VSLENLKNTADIFLEKFDPSKIELGFTGGEPTVNPNFLDFCKHLNEKGIHEIYVTTNGTRTVDYYKTLLDVVSNITFSQHFEFSKLDEFLPKVKELSDYKKSKIRVQVMLHANYFNEACETVKYLKENNINYQIRRIRRNMPATIPMPSLEYTQEQLDWFFANTENNKTITRNIDVYFEDGTVEQYHANEVQGNLLNKFSGWTCWAGLHYVTIHTDGSVWRGNCKQGGSLGNLNDGTFQMPEDTVLCKKINCTCAPEVAIKKVKDKRYIRYLED
jgi:organic radical activating enzyme